MQNISEMLGGTGASQRKIVKLTLNLVETKITGIIRVELKVGGQR